MKATKKSPYTDRENVTAIYVYDNGPHNVIVTFDFYGGTSVVKVYSYNAWESIKTCGIIRRGVPIYY